MSPFLSWRPLVGSLRALTSAEMAALRCIAAARTGFLLAALHSVAERVNPRKPRPPAPHQSPLASQPGKCPHSAAEGKSRETRWRAKRRAPEACDLPHPWGTCLAGYRAATELQVVMAGAWIAVSGSAHGERRVSGVRRAAPLWWFFPDRRVSTDPLERCQLQRASRATSERQKRNGDIPQFPAQRANGVRPLARRSIQLRS